MASSTKTPAISVVVFVLNAASTIERSLMSVLSNDQPLVELLVMDGGSTDGTVEILNKYANRIAHWRSYPDGSAVVAINEGVQRATGDIICLLPADDWVEPGSLHFVRDRFAENPQLEVLSCGTRFAHFAGDGQLVVDAEFIARSDLEFNMRRILRCPLTAGRFILRRLYTDLGSYDPKITMSNDLDFLIRALLKRPVCETLPRLVYSYRMHAGSRTLGGNPEMVIQMMRDNIKVAKIHLADTRLFPEEKNELLSMHGRASARYAWMLASRRNYRDAAGVLSSTIALNWYWPFQVLFWIARRYLWRRSPF